jgi:hypothetical protein
VDKLFSQPKQSLRSEEQRLLGKNGECRIQSRDSRWMPWCVYVPIPDIKEYNMYGDEDLFFTRSNSWTSFSNLFTTGKQIFT